MIVLFKENMIVFVYKIIYSTI